MSRMFLAKLAALAGLAALASPPAAAQTLQEVGSRFHGDWRIATMVNVGNGQKLCTAETISLFDQVFAVVLYENDDAFVEIRDVTWDYVNGDPLRFNLIVDGDEQTVIGQGWEGSMSLDLLDAEARADLLGRLSQGTRLDLRMPNRSRVAQFPLDGAGDAIAAAEECWQTIRAGGDYQP